MSINPQSLLTLLEQCASIRHFRQLHALLITSNLSELNPFSSKLISFTALSSHPEHLTYSYKIFSRLATPTIFNYNTIIRGYSMSRNPNKSLSIYVEMIRSGMKGDYLTYPFLIKASARLLFDKHGLVLHEIVFKDGYDADRFIQNSLIHMYAAHGDAASARKVFDEVCVKNLVTWNSMLDGYCKCGDVKMGKEVFHVMPERDVVSWSSLIDGYVKGGEYREALELFDRMKRVGPKANEVTMVSVLCACAHLGLLDQGRMMESYIKENGMDLNLVLVTSLVDMYAKCGAIPEALSMFRKVDKYHTDILIWNTMIGGLATHGLVRESLELFDEMQLLRIRSDEITYLCLLTACAHGGLVKEAWYFFESLDKIGMTPKSEHYACMVDVLSKAGQVSEAYKFLCEMPVEPTASMYGALLSGCTNHGRLDLAEIVGKKLLEVDPDHDGRYVGLSNVYAVDKRWDESRSLRQAMESKGVKKSPGCSYVEVSGTLHNFIAHDKTHPCKDSIYRMLNFILEEMKLVDDYENQQFLLCDVKPQR